MKKRDLFGNIVSIRTAKNNTVYSGTGFFVKTEDERLYLVTATHVARETTSNTDVWIRDKVTGLPKAIKINKLNKMVIWLQHPIADISILEIKERNEIDLTEYYLDLRLFVNDFNDIPEREDSVTMFGLPDVYIDLKLSPFTCDCKVASDLWISYFDVTGTTFKCFMLDKPSTQGFSGGPVLLFEDDKAKCYGIIHGTRQDNTGGKLAIVVHSAYLYELISYARNS